MSPHPTPMRASLRWAVGIALPVLVIDELVKSMARLGLAGCSSTLLGQCSYQIVGPLRLVRTLNAGSALGFRQGWWVWLVLAGCGLLLIPLYARWLRGGGWVAVIAVGLQAGGAVGNLLDRLLLGGASDVLYVGGGPTWNLADVALALGTLLATWALAQRRAVRSAGTLPIMG
jgi:signal peptidase II